MKAMSLGAVPTAPGRAVETMKAISSHRAQIELFTYPGEMGEDEAREAGFSAVVLGSIQSGSTTASDTRQAALQMAGRGVELLLFAGGDGTARDIYEAVSTRVPVLGIPAGVKIHSSVFAVNPRWAAQLTKEFLKGRAELREMEVMDIDEDLFRRGQISARLYGYLNVPFERRLIQGAKAGSSGSPEEPLALAKHVVDNMIPDVFYILGPGTTVKAIGDLLGIDKTLLGVDLIRGGQLAGKDLNEQQLLGLITGERAKIVVTVIGGQGYIFGRGNQQISPQVIREVGTDNVMVVSTRSKLVSLDGPLLTDSGDHELDKSLSGYVRVITGYNEEAVWRVAC